MINIFKKLATSGINLDEKQILFFDVETPNPRNDRICQIGIIVEKNRQTILKKSILINPETKFADLNMEIHGITPNSVKDAPVFPDVWKELEQYFKSSLIVAYNAHFDLNVLCKTLYAYNLRIPTFEYIDPLKKAEIIFPDLPKHSLDAVSEECGYTMQHHHDAMDDVIALQNIYYVFEDEGLWNESDHQLYEFDIHTINTSQPKERHYSDKTEAIKSLKKIIGSISSDGILTSKEILSLQLWMSIHSDLEGTYPFDKLFKFVNSSLIDGVIDSSENDELLDIFAKFIDPVHNSCSCSSNALDVTGKNVCLTGNFCCGSKKQVSDTLSDMGAVICNSVTKKTDIVIVGGQGSDAYAFGNYGAKVKRAMELQEAGQNIEIISEADFFKTN